jgi:hypothetical protein
VPVEGQAICSATQLTTQWPSEQSSPALHSVPQKPQFEGSVFVLAQ